MASTDTFPGAPINTDPITTMAVSSAYPNTSNSCASSIPAIVPFESTDPLSVGSQQAPSSVEPRSTAPEETRSGSAASNSAAPLSVDPSTSTATSSADETTSTAATMTEATTSTTGTIAITTTTNSVGMIVTGRISPAIPTQALFNETIARCNNCLFLIRKLRNKQDRVSDVFLNYVDGMDYGGLFPCVQSYKDFGSLMREVMNMFEKLDYYSRRLPKVVPPIDNINMMRTLYSQEHTMNHTDISSLVEKMIDSGNWNEGNYQIFYYLSELLRMNPQRKRFSIWKRKPMDFPWLNTQATTGHIAFENAYNAARKEIVNKSLGIYPRTLHQTDTTLVIEFRFGCGGTKVITDNDVVYTMKFLLVEKSGSVDFINMVATQEEWEFYNDFGKTTVNAFKPSRYEVYRRLTRQANKHLLTCFGSNANRWTAHTLIQFVSLFGKYREVFTARCRGCRLILKDNLPPLNFDIRTPTTAYHETCH